MNLDEYEKDCDAIRKTNNELLELFDVSLNKSGLSGKTIKRHLTNVNFYINTFLLLEEPNPMEYGINMIDDFLGNFFIRKCMWSTPGNIKSAAASIKKFYKCMLEHDKITKADYDFLCSEIKDGMDVWQDNCAMYNDPDAPNPFYVF